MGQKRPKQPRAPMAAAGGEGVGVPGVLRCELGGAMTFGYLAAKHAAAE